VIVPRIKVKAKVARAVTAPTFEFLDGIDQLIVRHGRPSDLELHSAPGWTPNSWYKSSAGIAYFKSVGRTPRG
jgi:hypothetical protein